MQRVIKPVVEEDRLVAILGRTHAPLKRVPVNRARAWQHVLLLAFYSFLSFKNNTTATKKNVQDPSSPNTFSGHETLNHILYANVINIY